MRLRSKEGKWVFCLAVENPLDTQWFKVAGIGTETSEEAAREFFKKELSIPGYFLVKLSAKMAERYYLRSALKEERRAHSDSGFREKR